MIYYPEAVCGRLSIWDAKEVDSNGPVASTRTTLTLKPRTVTELAEKLKREKQVSCTEVTRVTVYALKGAARMNEVGVAAKRKSERLDADAFRIVSISRFRRRHWQVEFRATIVLRIILFLLLVCTEQYMSHRLKWLILLLKFFEILVQSAWLMLNFLLF